MLTRSNIVNGAWILGPGSDVPPGGWASLGKGDTFATEVRWNVSGLSDNAGQPLVSGGKYRFQVMLHDGDQNNTGGDSGEACMAVGAY